MKRGSTIFLKLAVISIGLIVLALCIFALPPTIGHIDFNGYDPILLGMYLTAVPFFIAIYQTLKLLHYIDKNSAFSDLSTKALKIIKYCSFAVSAMYAAGMPYIVIVADKDDAPGAVAIALVFVLAPLVIAVFAAVLQRLLQNAIDIKAENDLTV